MREHARKVTAAVDSRLINELGSSRPGGTRSESFAKTKSGEEASIREYYLFKSNRYRSRSISIKVEHTKLSIEGSLDRGEPRSRGASIKGSMSSLRDLKYDVKHGCVALDNTAHRH